MDFPPFKMKRPIPYSSRGGWLIRTVLFVAIFGPGEDVRLEFEAPADAVPAGWTRRVVLETDGWCKDMDLYTKDGGLHRNQWCCLARHRR